MRCAALIAVATAVTLAGCGDDRSKDRSATPTATGAQTCAPHDEAIWPPASQCNSDPTDVARSFAGTYVGLDGKLQIGEFRQDADDPAAGEIDIFRRGEDGRRLHGIASTLSLRALDDADHWYVTSARSPEVELTEPRALAPIGSPVTVKGRGRGFEGNVVIEVRAAYATTALARRAVIAGSMETREPFSARLTFTAPAGVATGAILAKTGSGTAVADGFAALPVAILPR